jgi:hypothetical protein
MPRRDNDIDPSVGFRIFLATTRVLCVCGFGVIKVWVLPDDQGFVKRVEVFACFITAEGESLLFAMGRCQMQREGVCNVKLRFKAGNDVHDETMSDILVVVC